MDMPRTSIWRPPRILSDADARSTFQHAILCWITQDTELKVFDRLKVGPAEEVGDEDDTGHGVEFFGGGACDFAEICGQLRDGHFFEEDMPEQALPSSGDNFEASRSDEP
jgi:hypothetical protein